VEGILACSRAIGDFFLKPYISSHPDITTVPFRPSFSSSSSSPEPNDIADQLKASRASFVILASDGVWDVMTSQEAVELVWDEIAKLQQPRQQGGGEDQHHHDHHDGGDGGDWSICFSAAYSLVQEAIKRGTQDNVSAVVLCYLEVLFPNDHDDDYRHHHVGAH